MAAGLTALASLGFGLAALGNLVQMARGRSLEVPWATLGAAALVMTGSYVVAGQIGALAFFLLRPMRRSVVGWMLTGFWIAFAAYGTVGVALAVFHEPVGALFLEDSSQLEVWQLVRWTPWMGGIGVIGGAWQWWKEHADGD